MKRRDFLIVCGAPLTLVGLASYAHAVSWTAFCTKCDWKAGGSGGSPSYKTGDKCPTYKCTGRVIVSTL